MKIQDNLDELKKIEKRLAYRPHKIIKENFYYYHTWSFTGGNSVLMNFLQYMINKDYFSEEFTGYGIDIVDDEETLYETFAMTKRGWNWFKEEMKIGRSWNEDVRLSKELKSIEVGNIQHS